MAKEPLRYREDFTDSGMSSAQAMDAGRAESAAMLTGRGLSGRFARLLAKRYAALSMLCDGEHCQNTTTTTAKPDAHGTWPGTGGWVHSHDLDFCAACQANGSMNAAIARGARPRGAQA